MLSRGNRDGRPNYSYGELEDMGYAAVIDATLSVCVLANELGAEKARRERAHERQRRAGCEVLDA
mgnify:CR=1 FL=1